MAAPQRQAIAVGMLVALLVGAAMWNVSWMLRQRDNARQIRGDLAACEDEATGIEALRGKPKLAATESLGVQQLGERIEAASREAASTQNGLTRRRTLLAVRLPLVTRPRPDRSHKWLSVD